MGILWDIYCMNAFMGGTQHRISTERLCQLLSGDGKSYDSRGDHIAATTISYRK